VQQIAQTFGVDWPHLTAQVISFSIVCALLYWLAYTPVLQMLEARRRQIAQGLENTEKINAALAAIDAQREGIISAAHVEAARLIDEARAAAARVKELEAQRARAAADRILIRAREQTRHQHDRMLAELRREVGHLVIETTAAVSGRVLTEDDQRRLVEETTRELRAA
jgi:F-type H+-transporting ATPase subunit b